MAERGNAKLTESETRLLEYYNKNTAWMDRASKYGPRPALTVDGLVMLQEKLVLILRGREPFKGFWALPGGFVEYGETLEDAVIREINEETGLITSVKTLIGVYSAPGRDPRHHTVSAVFLLEKIGGELVAGDDAGNVDMFSLENLPELAFDHLDIVSDFLNWKNKK